MRRVALVVLLATLGAGCSFAFVNGPSSGNRPVPENWACTTSRVFPVIDGVAGAAYLAAGGAMLVDPEAVSSSYWAVSDIETTTIGVAYIAWGGFLVWSAINGWRKVDECRELMREQEQIRGPSRAYTRFDPHQSRQDRQAWRGSCTAGPAV